MYNENIVHRLKVLVENLFTGSCIFFIKLFTKTKICKKIFERPVIQQ